MSRVYLKEIMVENLQNLTKEMDTQIHEPQQTPTSMDWKKFTLRHLESIFQKSKTKRGSWKQ